MSILEHSSNEYYITMRDDTDLDSLDAGLNKLVEDEDDNPDGIIIDFDNTMFDAVLSTMSSAFENPSKEIHIYITVENDTEENWKRIGDTLGMSLLDLAHAKKLVTKIYRAHLKYDDDYSPSEDELQEIREVKARGIDFISNNSLWNKPLPNAKLTEDYHGTAIKLSRMDQLKEDNPNFFFYDWYDALLFHLSGDEDITGLLQNIEALLLQTKEA